MFKRVNSDVVPFSINSPAGNRYAFGTTDVSNDIDVNYNENIKKGFGTGPNDFPELEDFNALMFTGSYLAAYLYQAGIPEWNDKQKYYINSIAMGSDGNLYKSLTGTEESPNVNNNPTLLGSVSWKSIISDGVKLTGNQTIAGVKTFSDNPQSTATQSTVAYALTRKDYVDGLNAQNVKLTGNQTIAGTKTFSSTIDGSITGNAATATKLATARTINGVAFDGTANITVADSTKAPLTGTGASGTWGISVTGNSATATKLATARTIGGVSFDGTANINLPGVNTAGNQNTTGNAATVTNGVYTTGNQTIAGVKTFQGDIILDNGTSDSGNIVFRDTVNSSRFNIDLWNEKIRMISAYRNNPIETPLQIELSSRITQMYGRDTLVSFAQSLQSNGYKIISNTAGGEKVVLQWGFMSEGNVTQTVTFPTAFPTACTVFIPVLIGAGAKYASLEYAPTKTQATITKSIDYSWRWFAIGY